MLLDAQSHDPFRDPQLLRSLRAVSASELERVDDHLLFTYRPFRLSLPGINKEQGKVAFRITRDVTYQCL